MIVINSEKEDNKFTSKLSNINVVFGGVTSSFVRLAFGASKGVVLRLSKTC